MRQVVRISLVVAVVLSLAVGIALAEHPGDFSKQIAGTYLLTSESNALILQLKRDGNMTLIISDQFLNQGILDQSFSDTLGTWKRAGSHKVVVNTVNIAFDADTFVGVAAVRYELSFDRHFQEAVLSCNGAIYAPGVDPFSGADPLTDSEFDCGELHLKRLP
jgi:hypothetical protein